MTYWEKRAVRRMQQTQARADDVLVRIGKALLRAMSELTDDTRRIAARFAHSYDLTPDEAQALLKQPCGREEYERLLVKIGGMPNGAEKRRLMARAASGGYAYRIDTASKLRDSIAAQMEILGGEMRDALREGLDATAKETAEGVREDLRRHGLSVPEATQRAADEEWFGDNYSSRIWTNQQALRQLLEDTIPAGLATGKSPKKITAEVAERMNVAYWQAERLVRTEMSHMNNQASLAEYKRAGIDRYQWSSALDKRTCDACGALDGRVFEVDKARTGETLPPKHPFCRCTTLAYFGSRAGKQRRGRDANGRSVLLPGDMTHSEWAAWQAAGCPEDVAGRLQRERGNGIIDWSKAEFASQELLDKHYTKHLDESNGISPEEYVQRARALLGASDSEDVVSLVRSDGSVSRYRFSTNEFVVGTKDGKIRTFFWPVDKEAYWDDELHRNRET